MSEKVSELALECLKIDLERMRLKEEANNFMMEAISDISPWISSFIISLVESVKSGEKLSPEMVLGLLEKRAGRVIKLTINDFLGFVEELSDESLESLIADLQKILENRGEKET